MACLQRIDDADQVDRMPTVVPNRRAILDDEVVRRSVLTECPRYLGAIVEDQGSRIPTRRDGATHPVARRFLDDGRHRHADYIRMALTGSTCVARRAGASAATIATMTNSAGTAK
jgi:hypothetical protein